MKTYIIFVLSFLFPIFIFSQSNEVDLKSKNRWIDGITFIPLNMQLVLSEPNNEIFQKGKTPWGGSIHPQLLFQKELKKDIDLFTGIGYSNNSESAKIAKSVESFSDLINIGWNNISNEDSSLLVGSVHYIDEYFTVPIGIRYYANPKDNKGIKMVLSTKFEFLFLINSKVDVDIVRKVDSGIFRLNITEPVFNSSYEKDAEAYFENTTEDFLLNFQFGGGYEWRTGKHFSFGHEIVMNAFLKKHKTNLLKQKMMIGTQLRLVYHFD